MMLRTEQLREFLRRAPFKNPGILPVLDNILIGPGFIFKTNLRIGCRMHLPEATETILINERDLAAILKTESEFLLVQPGVMVAGKLKQKIPFVDPALYPKMEADIDEREGIEFNSEMMDSLVVAKHFVSELPADGALQLVHIKDNFIAATDRFKMYYETLPKTFPNIKLFPSDIDFIAKLLDPLVYVKGNKYIFECPEIIYAINPTEDITPQFKMVADSFETEGQEFKIQKAELLSFCDFINSVNDSLLAICSLSKEGFNHPDPDKPAEYPYPLPDISFNFNAKIVAPALRHVPVSELCCKLIKSAVIIKEENITVALYGVVLNP